ncbi:hypothetical protein [Dryocola sp. LX212]
MLNFAPPVKQKEWIADIMPYDNTSKNNIRQPHLSTGMGNNDVLVRKGDAFHAPEHAVYLLQSGAIHLEAKLNEIHSAESHVIGTLLPGDPVGILAKYVSGVNFCYRAMDDCVLHKLSENFLQETEGCTLVEQVFRALSLTTLRIILSHSAVDIFRGYPRIRALIYLYMEMKRSGGLKEQKLLPFVLSRASLPQEQVVAVLSTLTEQAYLDIRRGKLNAINFPLPLEYQEKEVSAMSDIARTYPTFQMM